MGSVNELDKTWVRLFICHSSDSQHCPTSRSSPGLRLYHWGLQGKLKEVELPLSGLRLWEVWQTTTCGVCICPCTARRPTDYAANFHTAFYTATDRKSNIAWSVTIHMRGVKAKARGMWFSSHGLRERHVFLFPMLLLWWLVVGLLYMEKWTVVANWHRWCWWAWKVLKGNCFHTLCGLK